LLAFLVVAKTSDLAACYGTIQGSFRVTEVLVNEFGKSGIDGELYCAIAKFATMEKESETIILKASEPHEMAIFTRTVTREFFWKLIRGLFGSAETKLIVS
jgi:hypothetical protein